MSTQLTLFDEDTVHRLLSMHECIPLMRATLARLSGGLSDQPLRTLFRPKGIDGIMAVMPCALGGGDDRAFGFKCIAIFPGNGAHGLDAHQGVVLLFDPLTGVPLALFNASAITLIRTAAVSAVATEVLAPPAAADLGVIGTGLQARAHVEAMLASRSLRCIRVAGRTPDRAHRFCGRLAPTLPPAVQLLPCASIEEAVRGSDILVTATSSAEPVIRSEWIRPGTHINAIGACIPEHRELDAATLRRARLYADRRESLLNEAGDFLLARREGVIDESHLLGEIGDVINGTIAGRLAADDITLFKSLGLAAEDIAAARFIYRRARSETGGRTVSL